MYRFNPLTLKNISTTVVDCPVCNSTLQKKNITERKLDECYECIQDDRPFNYGRANKGYCSCTYRDADILEITCLKCVENEASKISKMINDEAEHDHMLFLSTWHRGVRGKLSCYGIKKLQKLARHKELKGYSKLNKEQLINSLEKITKETDFPIP